MKVRPAAGARPAGYSCRANGSTGEIVLYSLIGDDGWGDGISSTAFKQDLDGLGPVSTINLRINSPGGYVFEGVTMLNLLVQHQAKVIVHVDGLAASIASVIAMAGDEIRIADSAMMMIHNAATFAWGDARDLRAAADTLDTITGVIKNTYVKRTKQTEDALTTMMDAETWFTAAQALELGFADTVVEPMQVAACLDPRFKFRNIPAALQQSKNQAAPQSSPQHRPNVERLGARMQGLRVTALRERMRR